MNGLSRRESAVATFRRLPLVLVSFVALQSVTVAIEVTSAPTIDQPTNGHLARILNFTTDVPTRASLRVHGPGEAWMVQSDVLRTEHSIPLFGLTFEKDYVVDNLQLADSEGNMVTLGDMLSITTAARPDSLPTFNVLTSIPERMEPGLTLFPVRGHTIGVDAQGTPRWHYSGSGAEIHRAANGQFLARINDTIREFDPLGSLTRAWYATGEPPTQLINFAAPVDADGFHHDVFLIASTGNILTLSQTRRTVDNFPISETDPNARGTLEIRSDEVLELATDGTIVNRWDLADMLDPRRGGYGLFRNSVADWSHSNAVVHDPSDDSIIVSVRNQDAVIKFGRTTGELKWILGPHEGWGPEFEQFLLDPVGEEFEWPYHTHAPMLLPNGNLLVHDNGNFRARPFDPPLSNEENYTRAVEYVVDEATMQVTQVWEYGKDAETVIYTPTLGDADWLSETDNVLITFGNPQFINHEAQSPVSARIVEVDRAGEVVFDLQVSHSDGMSTQTVYRAERIPSLYGPEYTMTMLPIALPPGDFNGNGIVEQADLDLVLSHWGADATTPPEGWDHDLPSGLVDQNELDKVLLGWGDTSTIAPVAATPEPSTVVLGVLAASLLIGWQQRPRK